MVGKEYFGVVDYERSINHMDHDSKICADVFVARDGKQPRYRLAIAHAQGKYSNMQGKYFYFRLEKELKEKWIEICQA